jgi:hypothetical protein
MKITFYLLPILCMLIFSCEQQNSAPNAINPSTTNSNPCNEVLSSPTWYPVEVGNEWKWNSLLGSFRVRITNDTIMNGRSYFTSRFVGGTILAYLNDWCWIYGYKTATGDLREYDPQTGLDWLYLPNNPTVGQSWFRQGDQWEVLSVNSPLQTASCTYSNLLKVQVTDTSDGSISYGYFGKGLGLIYCRDATNSAISYYLQDVNVSW